MYKLDRFSQHYNNRVIEHIVNLAEEEIQSAVFQKGLGRCNAEIYESEHYLFLQSNPVGVVAIIVKGTNTMYNCLRMHEDTGKTKTHLNRIKRWAKLTGVKTVYSYYTV